jgi:hypothetical protein
MKEPDFDSAPLRFVFLGESIVSDWRNPQATTSRAVLRALTSLGHDAVYLEPRLNSATVSLLRQRGAGPVRAFDRRYPDLQYRTVDLPLEREAGAWLGQFASTSDAIVLLEGTPGYLVEHAKAFSSERMAVLIEDPRPSSWGWAFTQLRSARDPESVTPFRPAVLPRGQNPGAGADARDIDALLVVYDDAELANEMMSETEEYDCLVAGSADLPGWRFLPEVDLPDYYRRSKRTMIIDNGNRPVDPARQLLADAEGTEATGVERAGLWESSDQPNSRRSADASPKHAAFGPEFNATFVAGRIVEAVRAPLTAT